MLQLLKVHANMENASPRPCCCEGGECWKRELGPVVVGVGGAGVDPA